MDKDEKNKKPLVLADAANPEWADDTPTKSYEQVQEFKNRPDSVHDPRRVAGADIKVPNSIVNTLPERIEAASHARNLADIEERLNRNKEDEATLEKRRKRNALFSAIGDGVSALSNLYFTTKGSPSADQSKSMSKAVQEGYNRDLGILERRRQQLMQMKERAIASHNTNMYKLQEMRIKQQLADARMELDKAKGQAAVILAKNKVVELERKLKIAEDRLKQYQDESNSRIKKNQQTGDAAEYRAKKYGQGVDNANYNRNRNTSDQIANRNAPTTSTSTTTTVDDEGNEKTTTRTTTTRKGGGGRGGSGRGGNRSSKFKNTKALLDNI